MPEFNIVDILAPVVSVLAVIIAYLVGTRQLYVDVVIKDRLQAIKEYRRILKELYYYTNPVTIDMAIQSNTQSEEIRNLLKSQSALECKLLEIFYPDGDVLKALKELVRQAIAYTKSGKKGPKYNNIRDENLKLMKLYNFASWQYAQMHSTGRKGGSIKDFDKSFAKTLKSLDQDVAIKKTIERLLIKYKVSC